MTDKAWKRSERYLAKRLGGERVPITGRVRSNSLPDIEHPRFSLEIKHRNKIPLWLYDALDQAEQAAKEGRMPVAIIHESGRNHDEDLVIIKLSDFETLIEDNDD